MKRSRQTQFLSNLQIGQVHRLSGRRNGVLDHGRVQRLPASRNFQKEIEKVPRLRHLLYCFNLFPFHLDGKCTEHVSSCDGGHFVYIQRAVLVNLPGWHLDTFEKLGFQYQSHETRLDSISRCWCHYQVEEVWILLKHYQLQGSHHPSWRNGSITTNHRHSSQTKATKLILRAFDRPWACASLFDVLYETLRELQHYRSESYGTITWLTSKNSPKTIYRPTNIVKDADYPSSVVLSKIKRNLLSVQRHLRLASWHFSLTTTARGTIQAEW